MANSITIEDSGYIEFVFPAAEGAAPLVKVLDVEIAAQAFYDANQNSDPNDPVAWGEAYREVAKKLELPEGLSQNALHRIAKACWERVRELAKKDDATPASE